MDSEPLAGERVLVLEDYIGENKAELQRLVNLLSRLNAVQLNRQLPNGWTVAGVLAHLAFWDCYAQATLHEWQRSGFRVPATQYDAINAAVESMSRVLPAPALLQWVRERAEACDQCVAGVPPNLVEAIEGGGKANFLLRAKHRRHHLDQIDALLRA